MTATNQLTLDFAKTELHFKILDPNPIESASYAGLLGGVIAGMLIMFLVLSGSALNQYLKQYKDNKESRVYFEHFKSVVEESK